MMSVSDACKTVGVQEHSDLKYYYIVFRLKPANTEQQKSYKLASQLMTPTFNNT